MNQAAHANDHAPRIAVVGAGVVGLCAAIRLRERGLGSVTVLAERASRITSDAAGAFWYPFAAGPRSRVTAWSARSFEVLRELAGDADSGVRPIRLCQYYDGPAPEPWFAGPVADLAPIVAADLDAERGRHWSSGWTFTTWLMDTTRAMPWLRARLAALGGTTIEGAEARVEDVADLADRFDLVVFAPGVAAARVPVSGRTDGACFPIRGQVLRVRRPEGVSADVIHETVVTYVIPRTDDLILGGTAQEGDWSLEPREEDAADILARCRRIAPALPARVDDLDVLEHRVGLRPGRAEVRLELERVETGRGTLPVIHDHGHGGAGWTLAWGCADEVADLAASALGAAVGPGA